MELKLTGRAASPGIFVGPAVALSALAAHGRRQGSPAEEEMALAAAIVVTASKVAERADPFLAAMMVTVPISAGPAYVFLALEHGARFVEASTLVSLCANAATGVFTAVYALLARRRGLLLSLALALAAWFATVLALIERPWTMSEGFLLNVATFAAAILATRHLARESKPRQAPVRRWWDIPFRAALVGVPASVGSPIGCFRVNIEGTINLLEAMRFFGVRRSL